MAAPIASATSRDFGALARDFPDLPVPVHLRNAPTKLMKDLGYGKGTKWEANFQHPSGFLPDGLKDIDFFRR